jgi:hypothetical protein
MGSWLRLQTETEIEHGGLLVRIRHLKLRTDRFYLMLFNNRTPMKKNNYSFTDHFNFTDYWPECFKLSKLTFHRQEPQTVLQGLELGAQAHRSSKS